MAEEKQNLYILDNTKHGIVIQMDDEGNINAQVMGNGGELVSMIASVLDGDDDNSIAEIFNAAAALLMMSKMMGGGPDPSLD